MDIGASLHRTGDFLLYLKLFDQCLMNGGGGEGILNVAT